MKGLQVKSVVHVTKVAAVVVWATDKSQTVSPSLQVSWQLYQLVGRVEGFVICNQILLAFPIIVLLIVPQLLKQLLCFLHSLNIFICGCCCFV